MFKKYWISAFSIASLIFGISPSRVDGYEGSNNDPRFTFCISSFREGYYQKTIDCLNDLMVTLNNRSDTIEALKYLGFCNGMLNRIDQAKDFFNEALDKDPDMELDTLEFPPNITLIYNQIKLERKLQKIDSVPLVKKKSPVIPVLMLGAGLVTAVPGGYFLMHAKDLYDVYNQKNPPRSQSTLDKEWSSYTSSLIKGCVFGGVSAVLLPVSLYLLLHNEKGPGKNVSLMVEKDRLVVAYSF